MTYVFVLWSGYSVFGDSLQNMTSNWLTCTNVGQWCPGDATVQSYAIWPCRICANCVHLTNISYWWKPLTELIYISYFLLKQNWCLNSINSNTSLIYVHRIFKSLKSELKINEKYLKFSLRLESFKFDINLFDYKFITPFFNAVVRSCVSITFYYCTVFE